MFLICAVTVAIGLIIYRVVKIGDWFEKSRMSRLSLRKHKNPNEQPPCENVPQMNPNDTIEISDDETDTSQAHELISSDAESTVSLASLNVSQEGFMHQFQKSTDSLESDEDMGDPASPLASSAKPNPSLFTWHSPNINDKKHVAEVSDDSDSSNDSHWESGLFHREQKKKAKISPEACIPSEYESTEDALPEVGIQHEQLISGIRVKFPIKPYSCQVAVMNKLIQGCVKKENCLLESPTGSGKTLALLCGVLAWHDHYCAEVEEYNAQQGGGDHEASNFREKLGKNFPNEFGEGSTAESNCCAEAGDCHAVLNDIASANQGAELKPSKIPKIYYGTRTHKQIEQVVRELKKTCYRHKKMTILSSRNQTCLQESTRNKTELCNDLLDPVKHIGCPYYNERNKKTLATFPAAERYGLGPVWDIEDLVAIGKDESACPYFAARSLMEYADIIFCPYNYIINPDIRESMQLDLQNQVIILDEAHNIEDICRNEASKDFREDDLRAVAVECKSLAKQRQKHDFTTYNNLNLYLLQLADFLKTITLDKVDYNSDNRSSRYWTGAELFELFNMHKLGDSAYNSFHAAYIAAMANLQEVKEENRQMSVKPVISDAAKRIMEKLVFAMRMITSKEFTNDYRACVTETTEKDVKSVTEDSWIDLKNGTSQRVRTLKLLCMNPGVTFSPLAESARSIILASGTLTPTASFQSELNTKFPHILNTAHVIPKDQVYATCVPRGPNGTTLRATYQNVNSWSFQDELGHVLLDICETVPHGVLCFFSSYNVMNTQMDRWKQNSTWSKIVATKQVFIEPRKRTDLTAIMNYYREVIRDTADGPKGGINGALFLAVFRGKVAEGIDFKDNEARCVVTVGIPFTVLKNPEIQMKREYNDLNTTRGLLKGSDWYVIQAFRALNQALGRCLRHINDWGAVLLVDERFLQQANKEYLPKWVKTMWINQSEYKLKEDLPNFIMRQKARETKN
ncbi:Fanconi anemia group J protein homolog isoform X1 [Andrena cerasifolii]|uniref:Fanconi anemia group J protein homolog isoform X1 n=1 Tax=Andrena cerasifolii TaxID=2819439 RepID=UPI004037BA92